MHAGAPRSALQRPDASKGREFALRYAATRSTGLGALRSYPAFRIPFTPARCRRRTEPTRSSSRPTFSDRGQPGRGGRLSRYANWSPRSWPRSIPLHASRTTASSPVRVLPPLTPAAPNQRLAFLLRKGDRVALFEPGQAGHTILSFSEFYVASCRHYDKSGTSPRLNPRSSVAGITTPSAAALVPPLRSSRATASRMAENAPGSRRQCG